MSWDYELAKKLRTMRSGASTAPVILEGVIVSPNPLKVSLYGGEVMAPPMALECVVGAQGFYRDSRSDRLYLEQWNVGDKVVCCLMGQTVVILGRLGGTAWTIPVR